MPRQPDQKFFAAFFKEAGLASSLKLRVRTVLPDKYPRTPDGRYFVVRSRLWRLANPALPPDIHDALVRALMAARRAVRDARGQSDAVAAARARVDAAKRALGERGPVWWQDGAPDYNRRMVTNTPYAAWHAEQAGLASTGER